MPDRRELTQQVLERARQLAFEGDELADIVVMLVAQGGFAPEPLDDALQLCRVLSGSEGGPEDDGPTAAGPDDIGGPRGDHDHPTLDLTMVRAAGLLELALRVGRFARPSPARLVRSARLEARTLEDR